MIAVYRPANESPTSSYGGGTPDSLRRERRSSTTCRASRAEGNQYDRRHDLHCLVDVHVLILPNVLLAKIGENGSVWPETIRAAWRAARMRCRPFRSHTCKPVSKSHRACTGTTGRTCTQSCKHTL